MMQLYKKRDFGSFISDTFSFFKQYGRNYFRNYMLLNGLLLILMVVVIVFGFREFFGVLFGSNISGQSYYFEEYFQNNLAVFIVIGIFLALLSTALMTINFLFPVFYMKRVSQGQEKIGTDDLMTDFKTNIKKVMILYAGLNFLVMPIALVIFMISYALILIFIGLILLLFIVPTLVNVINFLCFDYFNSNKGFFESLSYAVRSQFSYRNGRESSPYWKYWGATLIMAIICQVIISIFTAIPMVIFFIKLTTTTSNADFEQNPAENGLGIIFFVIYGISMLMSLLLMNMQYVNSGLMYYDSRTDLHQKTELAEIETIGTHE